MTPEKLNNTAQERTATAPRKTFMDLMRDYERAHASGQDTTDALYALAQACASSVVKKCLDPQRKTASEKPVTADGRTATADKPHKLTGSINYAMEDLRRGIMADIAHLRNLNENVNQATAFRYNEDGDYVREVVDKTADTATAELQVETLTDGIDLVHTAIVAILEQTRDHANGEGWLEKPYTLRRLSKKVLIQSADSAKWVDDETSPIREVYRAVRRAIQNSKAVQTDPRSGYLYIEDTATDPETSATETIYHRLRKWADLGGYERHGNYTADMKTAFDYRKTIELLNLTDKQARIIELRMQGYGYPAIGTYLGVTKQAVLNTIKKVQAKAEKIGFTLSMWKEMTEV